MSTTLLDTLRTDAKEALRDKNELKKNILRLVIGEIETQESRTGKSMTDEQVEKVVRKLIASNEETLKARPDERLNQEIEILDFYLPQLATIDEIRNNLVVETLREMKSDGQATGFAIKTLKDLGIAANGNDVAMVVKEIRAERIE